MTVRDITSTLAPLLQILELEQPPVVATPQLRDWAQDAGVTWPVGVVIRRLRERGWLLDLKTRGVWEFAPAARAGAFGGGDPLVELRATLKRDPDAPFAVAAESAAYLLGLASRRPAREVIGTPSGIRVPTALKGYRIARWSPSTPTTERSGLPVWTTTTLLASMAAMPATYADWPNVGEWLPSAARDVDIGALATELHGRPRSAWARAAYLLDCGGREDTADTLLEMAPAGAGPYYLGGRGRSARYDSKYDVVDSTGMELGNE
jgi:hypothetical protein